MIIQKYHAKAEYDRENNLSDIFLHAQTATTT